MFSDGKYFNDCVGLLKEFKKGEEKTTNTNKKVP